MLISNALFDLTNYDSPKRSNETYVLVLKLLQLNITTRPVGENTRITGNF